MDGAVKSLLVFVGAGVGGNARFWLGIWVANRYHHLEFPWATFFINVSGSLLIGLFYGLLSVSSWSDNWRPLVAIGVLGGYTTFSTFSWETLQLMSSRSYLLAAYNVLGSVIFGLVGCWGGLVLSRLITGGRS